MGTVVAQDIFQSKLDSIFIGMEGVTGIADDMIIAGRDKMEHDKFPSIYGKVYEQQPDSQLGKDPVQAVTGIFLWPLLVKTWNHTRPKENPGTHSYGVPTRQTMRSFLGMINYLNRYSALSAHLAAPLSALTHQTTD